MTPLSNKQRSVLLAALCTAVLATGCETHSTPKVNSSSTEAFESSLIRMRESLSEAERTDLGFALVTLGVSQQRADAEHADELFLKLVHGKTAKEIIAAAHAIPKNRPTLPADESEVPAELADDSPVHRFILPTIDGRKSRAAPIVAVDQAGRVLAAWAAPTSTGQESLYLSHSPDRGKSFSEPKIVAQSAFFEDKDFENVSMRPLLAARGDAWELAWTQSVANNSSFCLVNKTSTDGGITFGNPVCPQGSLEAKPTHAFLAASNDQVAFVWHDHRNARPSTIVSFRDTPETFNEAALFKCSESNRDAWSMPLGMALDELGNCFVIIREVSPDGESLLLCSKKSDVEDFEVNHKLLKNVTTEIELGSFIVASSRLHLCWTEGPAGHTRVHYGTASTRDGDLKTFEIDPSSLGPQCDCKLKISTSGVVHTVWTDEIHDATFTAQSQGQPVQRACQVMYSTFSAGNETFSEPQCVSESQKLQSCNPSIAVSPRSDVFVIWNEDNGSQDAIVIKRMPPLVSRL